MQAIDRLSEKKQSPEGNMFLVIRHMEQLLNPSLSDGMFKI